MLLGKDLRRRHERALIAVFPNVPDAGRRDHRLAGADVALNQAVHQRAGAHVVRSAQNRALLCARGREGEAVEKLPRVLPFHLQSAGAAALAAHPPHRAREHEQLLKDQPPPRQLQRAEIGGEVDVLVSKARLRKPVLVQDLLRQRVRQIVSAEIERCAHRVEHHALRQPRAQGIDRHDPPRHAPGRARAVLALGHRVRQRLFLPDEADFSIKNIGLPLMQGVLSIGLVEIGDLHRARVVHGAELHQLHAAANAVQARGRRDHRPDAHRVPGHGQRNGRKSRAVLVSSRKERHEIAHGVHAQLLEGFGLLRPHAPQRGDGALCRDHHACLHVYFTKLMV